MGASQAVTRLQEIPSSAQTLQEDAEPTEQQQDGDNWMEAAPLPGLPSSLSAGETPVTV